MFFRAFYAIPQTMRGPGGDLVNAVRGTLDTLARYVTDRRPRHLAFTRELAMEVDRVRAFLNDRS